MATPTKPLLLGLLLAVGLIASACGSEPESVIVGAADDDAQGEAEAPASDITDAGAAVLRGAVFEGPTSVDDLLGTSWVIETVNGEPYLDEAGLTFFIDNDFSIAYNDPCSAGVGELRLEGDTYRFEPWAPNTPDCPGHPAALFAKAGSTFSITLSDGVLAVAGPTGQLTATHFQSVSVHDELLELPSVPAPNVPMPASSDPADVDPRDTSPIPMCESLDTRAIDIEDLDDDVFASFLRLHVVKDDLPFMTDVGIDEFGPGGAVVIEMSALYGPTIEWIAEVLGSTPTCLWLEGDRGEADGVDEEPPATTVVVGPATTIGEG